MTQQQLGDRVGTKFQQIQKYETGANRVSASRLWDIAAVLGVSTDFFFDGLKGDAAAHEQEMQQTNTKEAQELIGFYYAIPENQRRRLFDLACVLSNAG